MRSFALVLGAWHGLVGIAAFVAGVWLAIMAAFSVHDPEAWGPLAFGLILAFSGFASIVALALAAQGGKHARDAGGALVLPLVAFVLWSLTWPHGGLLPSLVLVPGAILGCLVLGGRADTE